MVAVATVRSRSVGHGGHTGGGDPNEYCPPLTTGSYVLVGPEIRDPAMKHSGYKFSEKHDPPDCLGRY